MSARDDLKEMIQIHLHTDPTVGWASCPHCEPRAEDLTQEIADYVAQWLWDEMSSDEEGICFHWAAESGGEYEQRLRKPAVSPMQCWRQAELHREQAIMRAIEAAMNDGMPRERILTATSLTDPGTKRRFRYDRSYGVWKEFFSE
jgi:hypothetical protein